jgi:hypothetical protein
MEVNLHRNIYKIDLINNNQKVIININMKK